MHCLQCIKNVKGDTIAPPLVTQLLCDRAALATTNENNIDENNTDTQKCSQAGIDTHSDSDDECNDNV